MQLTVCSECTRSKVEDWRRNRGWKQLNNEFRQVFTEIEDFWSWVEKVEKMGRVLRRILAAGYSHLLELIHLMGEMGMNIMDFELGK